MVNRLILILKCSIKQGIKSTSRVCLRNYLCIYIFRFLTSAVIMFERDIQRRILSLIYLSPSASATIEASSSSAGYFPLWRRRLRSERFYPFGAAGSDLTIGEVTLIKVRIEISVCQFRTDGEPTRSDCAITTKEMQPEREQNN